MALNNGFTEQAQGALRLAHEIVQQKRHSQLDVEHILLALLEPRAGLVSQVITTLGGDPRVLSRRLNDALDASPRLYSSYSSMAQQIHISMRAQRVVSEAANEAQAMDDEFIGVEHLFLVIASERGGGAARLLSEMGIDRERILRVLRPIRDQAPGDDMNMSSHYHQLRTRVLRMEGELAALRAELELLIAREQEPEQT